MKLRTFARHIREGLRNLKRNGWMTFASLSAVTVTLLLLGVFLLLAYNVQEFSQQVESQVEMSVFVKDGVQRADVLQMEQQMKNLPGIGTVTFVPKESGIQQLKDKFQDNAELLNGLEDDANNPLPDKFVIKAEDPLQTAAIAQKIETMPLVERVNYGKGTVEKMFTITHYVRNAGAVFVIGLCFTALFLISNTIKITIFARRREIEIMRLVGATNWFIRWPFLIEGLTIGVLGSLLPIVVLGFGYRYLANDVVGVMIFHFANFDPLMYTVGGILLLIGGLIGMIGSVMSISRFLRI
ncbi:MAG: permease-like cell division protein FtsX [Tumebacillaceae bacterium]